MLPLRNELVVSWLMVHIETRDWLNERLVIWKVDRDKLERRKMKKVTMKKKRKRRRKRRRKKKKKKKLDRVSLSIVKPSG
jgi:hypothetical protein